MRLVITEKPSVARDLARVLGATRQRNGFLEGAGLRIVWCFGHMAELVPPEHYRPEWKKWRLDTLPMQPQSFQVRPREGAEEQLQTIRRLVHDQKVEDVVNACDAGREGELIFRYVMQIAERDLPVLRLWISSLTDASIRQGWKSLRPGGEYDGLAAAARCRSEADWLVGLNATRALTCACPDPGGVLSVGRVQTPTLAMIVARDRVIENFVPETFWQVKASFVVEHDGTHQWTGTWFSPTGRDRKDGQAAPRSERISDERFAASLVAAAKDQVGTLQLADRKKKRERPPLLYDLTALQRRANQRYSFSAQRTLQIAQELYEKFKLLTYPRTDARYLTPDQVPGLAEVVTGLAPIPPYAPHCSDVLARGIKGNKRFVDASEVGDHHAIIPTGRTPPSNLPTDHKKVFDLVARRFLAALSPDAWFDVSTLIVKVPCGVPLSDGSEDPQSYRAKGRVCTEEGWRRVDPPPQSKRGIDLPNLPAGSPAAVTKIRKVEGQTRPPHRHNDASILQGMETAGKSLDDASLKRAMRSCGLGTPATRAAILQTLISRKYVERKGKELWSCERGRAVIDAIPHEALRSPELTGRWEGRLAMIAEGEGERAVFMRDVQRYTQEVVAAIVSNPPPALADPREHGKSLGACPVCGEPVRLRGPVFACDTGRTCGFVVFSKMAGRKISARMVKKLLVDGHTESVKGFRSKKGKDFSAGLRWDAANKRVGFVFADSPREQTVLAVGSQCPRCGKGRLIQGRAAIGCDRWRDGCRFVVR